MELNEGRNIHKDEKQARKKEKTKHLFVVFATFLLQMALRCNTNVMCVGRLYFLFCQAES